MAEKKQKKIIDVTEEKAKTTAKKTTKAAKDEAEEVVKKAKKKATVEEAEEVVKEAKAKKNVAVDSHGNIVEIEDKGDPKPRAKKLRIFACILWVLAIIVEIIAILRLFRKIELFPDMSMMVFLIIAIVLDLLFFIPGSILWKKANHIDPMSEKNKAAWTAWNNLGTILAVLAFLPLLILVLMNKDLDAKTKKIVGAVAAVALVAAGASSFDYNPVSSEQLEQAKLEVEAAGYDTVYWATYSKKYHISEDCPSFHASENIYKGTVADAFEYGITEPCRRCIPALEDGE